MWSSLREIVVICPFCCVVKLMSLFVCAQWQYAGLYIYKIQVILHRPPLPPPPPPSLHRNSMARSASIWVLNVLFVFRFYCSHLVYIIATNRSKRSCCATIRWQNSSILPRRATIRNKLNEIYLLEWIILRNYQIQICTSQQTLLKL